jgi:cytochrome c oxidase assembly protein subunit 11
MSSNKNINTAAALAFVALLMFGFGYALVPLYDVFCKAVGLNGKTGTISTAAATEMTADTGRVVTVEFDANIHSSLPWSFGPMARKMTVHPGRIYETQYQAKNLTDGWITGQAVPSVAPSEASLYLNKTACFCFTQQTLGPHEEKLMPVRFIVDPRLPDTISLLTLSYTFFQTPGQAAAGAQPGSDI